MKSRIAWLVAVVIFLLPLISACSLAARLTATPVPPTATPQSAAAGQPTPMPPTVAEPTATSTAVAAATVLPSATSAPTVSSATSRPAFEKVACPMRLPTGLKEGRDVDCGYVVVPEDQGNPGARSIRLAVAVFHNPDGASKRDPIIYLSGGPGGSALEFAYLTYASQAKPLFAAGRDVILFDQRGVGLSKPALDCPAADELQLQLLNHMQNGKMLSVRERDDLQLQAYLACAKDLSATANLAAYNSASNAADVRDLRIALGYDQVNLWGVSYGTRLALEVMRRYPQGVRSVVIDSVLPPDVKPEVESPTNTMRVLDVLFNGCAADNACNRAYANLRQVFFDTANALDKQPATMTATNPLNNKSYTVTLDGSMFINLIFQMFYDTDMIPSLPQVIYQAKAGQYDELAQFEGLLIAQDSSISLGMYYSVYCNEQLPLSTPAEVEAAIARYPELASYYEDSTRSDFALCAGWNSGKTDPAESQPVHSDLPTLVMAGEYDPVTPPAWAKHAAQTLTKSYYFEYPGMGHGTSIGNSCPTGMMIAFINNPDVAPDSSCIARMGEPRFLVPASTADIKLEPFTDGQMGISGVVPVGWSEVSQGVHARNQSSLDQTALLQLAGSGATSAQIAQALLPQLGVSKLPDSGGSYKTAALTWKLYRANTTLQGQTFSIAYALADQGGKGYIVLLLTTPGDFDALNKAVFMPALDALKPFQ